MTRLAELNDEQATLLRRKADLLHTMALNILVERDMLDMDEVLEQLPEGTP
jgi:hypothetical protein